MFCPKCGASNSDNAAQCSSCGSSLSASGGYNNGYSNNYNNMPNVPNYLAWSIIVTILCCLPLGIPAIIYASQVDSKLRMGDYEGAVDSSNKAKTFCWISFGLALGLGVLYFLIAMANVF